MACKAPEGLPDGEFKLELVVPEDERTERERARLKADLHEALEDLRQGRTMAAADVAAAMVRRHG